METNQDQPSSFPEPQLSNGEYEHVAPDSNGTLQTSPPPTLTDGRSSIEHEQVEMSDLITQNHSQRDSLISSDLILPSSLHHPAWNSPSLQTMLPNARLSSSIPRHRYSPTNGWGCLYQPTRSSCPQDLLTKHMAWNVHKCTQLQYCAKVIGIPAYWQGLMSWSHPKHTVL